MSNKSILWEGSTREGDRELLMAITKEIVTGDEQHWQKCVDKMIGHISTREWQDKYTHRTFTFSIYYMKKLMKDTHTIELSFAMSTQAVDALYFLMSRDAETDNFAIKVKNVFQAVYGHKMPHETAEAIRILRNNVMHTGAIFGMPGSDRSAVVNDKSLEAFCNKHRSTSQLLTNQQILLGLTGAFNSLMGEVVVRVLGLKWDDLLRNGGPPSKLDYFCKPTDKQVYNDLAL